MVLEEFNFERQLEHKYQFKRGVEDADIRC